MPKSKQTEQRGRTKRNPRDPSPEHKQSSRSPNEDLTGDSDGTVDEEMEFDTGKFERPTPKS